jgi:hypothetical protein
MNNYMCAECEYATSRKNDLDRHFLTLKHKQKVQEKSVDSSKGVQNVLTVSSRKSLEHKCFFCNNVYKSAGNLTKHVKICGKKQYDDLHCKSELKEILSEVKHLKALVRKDEETISTLKSQNAHLHKLIDSAGSIIHTSVSNYVICY